MTAREHLNSAIQTIHRLADLDDVTLQSWFSDFKAEDESLGMIEDAIAAWKMFADEGAKDA